MNRMSSVFALSGLLACTACGSGGSGGKDLPENDPGTGSGTLEVDANVDASSLIRDANKPMEFETEFFVGVQVGGQDVVGATVTIESEAGVATLTEDQDGEYTGSQPGYFRVYTLSIIAGADTVQDVLLVGPKIHRITSPSDGSTQDAGVPLDVEWNESGAANAILDMRDEDEIAIDDTGEWTVPAAMLSGDPGGLYAERLTIERGETLPIAGAVAGSTLSVRVSNEVEFILDATP